MKPVPLQVELKKLIDQNGTDEFFRALADALTAMGKTWPEGHGARKLFDHAAQVSLTTRTMLATGG